MPFIRRQLLLPDNDMLASIIFLPFALLVDSAIYAIFGNTPGKALLGLSVTDIRGNSLSRVAYLLRNLHVWVFGMWFGLPLISLIGMAHQGIRVDKGKPATYDEAANYRVWAEPIGVLRITAFTVFAIGLISIFIAIQGVGKYYKEHEGTIASNAYGNRNHVEAKPAVWINPDTGRKVAISGVWNVKAEKNSTGQTVWAFIHSSGRALVVLGVEHVPGVTLHDYVSGYQHNVKGIMQFNSIGEFSHNAGLRVWKDDGEASNARGSRVHVQIEKLGSYYWRVVTIQEVPANFTNRDVKALMRQLWATVQ